MEILQSLKDRLKEEQWTRSTIENYSVKDLISLDELLDKISRGNKKQEAHDFCLEFVKNSPKSLTGLYILGCLSYELEDYDHADALVQVVEFFKENKKWNVCERILNKIISYQENSVYALKLLLNIYDNYIQKKDEEKKELLAKLVKQDAENGDAAKRLAESYEQSKDQNSAYKYYRSALRRYAKGKNYIAVEQVWKKLSAVIYEDVNFFLNISSMLADSNTDLAVTLLTNLLEILEKEIKIDEAIFVSKNILALEELNPRARQKMVELYRFKYQSNPQTEECIKSSGLLDPKTKFESAVKKFEKEILFAEGSYVYHRTWGIGRLTTISEGEFIVNFDGKQEHRMSYSMALKSLTPLTSEHIWVLKKEGNVGQLDQEESMKRILLSILKSFPDRALSIENFKEELVPSLIDKDQWNNWWNKAKNILKFEPSVGTQKDGRPRYVLKDIKVRFEDELLNNFFQSKKFEEKLKIFEEFIKEDIAGEEFEDQIKDMVSYFMEVVESTRYEYNERLISYVVLKIQHRTASFGVKEVPGNPRDFMEDLDKLIFVLNQNYRSDYKKEILNLVDLHYPDRREAFQEILWNDRGGLAPLVVDKLLKIMELEDLKQLIEQSFNNRFKMNPFIAFWFFEYLLKNLDGEESRYVRFGFDLSELYMEALYRIDTLGKLISQKKLNWFSPALYSADAKKLTSQADDLLFKTEAFKDFLLNHKNKDYVSKVYHLMKTSPGINAKNKSAIVKAIHKKYPEIDDSSADSDFIKEITVNYYDKDVIWSTQKGMDAQYKKLEELKEEKRLNLIELDKAREKGDLRENAEYQAAREKDTNLNNEIMHLGQLISKVKIIDLSQISGEEVTPGTVVSMVRHGKKENFTILGFWDTEEKKHIIAYNSPLARAIMGAKKNEEREMEIGGEKILIKISDIKPLKK